MKRTANGGEMHRNAETVRLLLLSHRCCDQEAALEQKYSREDEGGW